MTSKLVLKTKPKSESTILNESNIINTSDSNIEAIYKKRKLRDAILLSPNAYVGPIESSEDFMYVLDETHEHMIKKKITFNPALFKIYDEILVNSRDHFIRMNDKIIMQEKINKGLLPDNIKIDKDRVYHPVKHIDVIINEETGEISIFNDGDGIDVCFHNEEKCYVPELIFSNLLTSGNYDADEERKIGGQFGLGAKLCNIFSTEFTIETVDSYRGLKYVQTSRNNMSIIEKPIITKCSKTAKPYTKISYKADYPKFGLNAINDDQTIELLKKRVYDIASTSHIGGSAKIIVSLNGEQLKIKSFERYVDMFIGSRGEAKRLYMALNDDWEIAVCGSSAFTEENDMTMIGEQISFVNSVCTYKNGKHVDYIESMISKKILKIMSESTKSKSVIPTLAQIKDNMTIFINCNIVNPKFTSQVKEQLSSNISQFGTKCEIDEETVKKLMSSQYGILEGAKQLALFKAQKDFSKSDSKGGKNKKIYLEKVDEAEYACDSLAKRKKCCLILTEGDSAKSSAVTAFGALSEEERKYYGIMPLRGKCER